MKKSLIGLLILCFHFLSLAQKPGASIDVLHYRFELKLSDSSDQIKGHATIRFKSLKNVQYASFNLIKVRADKKGMTVTSVVESNKPYSFVHNNDQLTINFDASITTGTQKELEIIYEGIPADGLLITNNRYNHRSFFAENWPDRAQHWLPCVDHPADKATVEFVVTAPLHYQVVANGVQTEETILDNLEKLTRYSESTPISPKIMAIGASDFAVNYVGDVDCVPVYSWVYPENRDIGFYDYAQATDILSFFIERIGPYGFKKLANVQSKTTFGGLENANTIFYSENSVTGNRTSEALMAHEIAHQWFGNMVTESDWPHLWLSEGFATFLSVFYIQSRYGEDTARKMMLKNRNKVVEFDRENTKPVVDSSESDLRDLLNANSYQKGAWVLHMLRMQLGDSIFWRGVRSFYSRYAGKTASTDSLQKVFEEVSGSDLNVFFRQWLNTPGHPRLRITSEYDKAKKMVTITVTQIQTPLYQFPLEISVTGGPEDGLITKSVTINKKETSFTIPLSVQPQKITADPNVKLLFEEVK